MTQELTITLKISKQRFFAFLLLTLITIYLFTVFKPSLLLLKTTTTGGDTGSHYYTAFYLKHVLLPKGKVMGWQMANYAGYPLFYHYFPLPFLVMSLISLFVPLELAFKWVTALPAFLLPLSVFAMFRVMNFPQPVPSLGALFCLAYLFNENQSMWGGNLLSLLAGEFAFALSFAIFILFLGTFYRGIEEKRYTIINGILLALMGLSHGYTLAVWAGVGLFFLLRKNSIKENLLYMVKVHAIGVGLMSFWFIPFLANLPWTTPFRIKWHFASVYEIFPPVLIPFFALSVLAFILYIRDERARFLAFAAFVSIVGYFVAYPLGVVDVRFLTFLQFFLTIASAILGIRLSRLARLSFALPLILLPFVILWIELHTKKARHWAEWNYSGYEAKAAWSEAVEIFRFLREKGDAGRVVYENSPTYDRFGTMRIFESLTMFSGRYTLEGLYLHSSITAPYVFYIQAEVSKWASAPFRDYEVGSLDLKKGAKHMNLFAVTHFLVESEKVKEIVRNMPEFTYETKIGNIEIYRVNTSEPVYVKIPEYEPVAFVSKEWKRPFYDWFKNAEYLDVPLVWAPDEGIKEKFRLSTTRVTHIPQQPLKVPQHQIRTHVGEETIEFETTLPGYPHIIRISYHPFWKVEGAKEVYLVAPSFILVYPEATRVKLTFGKSIYNYLGELLTLVAILVVLSYLFKKVCFKKHVKSVKTLS